MSATIVGFEPNTPSPWGPIQGAERLAEGITSVWTASHGGIHLSCERLAAMPITLRRVVRDPGSRWFEEDCEWCAVALSFPEAFPTPPHHDGPPISYIAERTLRHYYPSAAAEFLKD